MGMKIDSEGKGYWKKDEVVEIKEEVIIEKPKVKKGKKR